MIALPHAVFSKNTRCSDNPSAWRAGFSPPEGVLEAHPREAMGACQKSPRRDSKSKTENLNRKTDPPRRNP
jgi:hypothetical protein